MVKKILIILCITIGLFTIAFFLYDFISTSKYTINYEIREDKILVHLNFPDVKSGTCKLNGKIETISEHQCLFEIENKKTIIEVKNFIFKKEIELNPNQNKVISMEITAPNKYLIVGETIRLKIDLAEIGNTKNSVQFLSKNNDICTVTEEGVVKAIGNGLCIIESSIDDFKETTELVSTDLLTLPTFERKKKSLPCNRYTQNDNNLLDQYLENRIALAGYKTRAGVVEALRFLTLHFPYRIEYFFENGRLNNNTGGAYVDGEGRYYHKGLYLHSSRKEQIIKRFSGPSIWGCPLTNWENEGNYIRGEKRPNGLDCSGFITWAMYNAGFDIKDTGAGDNKWRNDDLSDMGPHTPITLSFLNQNLLKAGDFIASQGHAAMVIGVTKEHVYVAESTVASSGVTISKWTYNELVNANELSYVILMSEYYKAEGEYTAMWE